MFDSIFSCASSAFLHILSSASECFLIKLMISVQLALPTKPKSRLNVFSN
ncbi:unnamed protein product [Meloidogyne enterolobii]|uniref:Uncharacterized protein n=1 Tax=Meloidogyne enterolobii TaxID=390850 RepID=A0ACB0ZGI4_MELEN